MGLLLRLAKCSILLLAASERIEETEERLSASTAANETLAGMPPSWLKYIEPDRHQMTRGLNALIRMAGRENALADEVILGAGTFGTVTAVTFKCDNKFKGAVKMQKCRKSIIRAEVAMLSQGCPRLLPAIAWGSGDDGKYYILTPRADGTLGDARFPRIYREEARGDKYAHYLVFFLDLVSALLYMHSHNLVHRDVKPDNVFYVCDPHDEQACCNAFLADFGLACKLGGRPSSVPMCDYSGVQGTLFFLPLNMQTAGSQLPHRLMPADIYAAGKTMSKVLGDPPRGAAGPWEELDEYWSNFMPHFGSRLERLLFAMQAENTVERPNAQQAYNVLHAIAKRIGLKKLNWPLVFSNRCHVSMKELRDGSQLP